MANFNTPYYLDNFEKVFRFSEYEDNQNYFLRLVYLIRRTEYAKYATPHGTYPALDVNITAHNGKKIFRDAYDVFDGGKSFKLLSESARDRAPNDLPHVIQVEQIYGYAPSVTHERGEQVDWTQPGLIDRSTAQNFEIWRDTSGDNTLPPFSVEYLEVEGVYRVRLGAAPGTLSVGDIVTIYAWKPTALNWYESETVTEPAAVAGISGAYVNVMMSTTINKTYNPTLGILQTTLTPGMAANFGGQNPSSVSNEPVNLTFNRWRSGNNVWNRIGADNTPAGTVLQLRKQASVEPPKNMSPGAEVFRTYFYRSEGMPQQATAFSPRDASGESVALLDLYTQPSASQYLTMVANGDPLRPASERIGQVMGDVWYKDAYWLRAQLQ